MTLTGGTRVGPYEALAPLGAGGMGEVWRARDTRLGLDVAIKVLPAAFTEDHERLARFEREAKVLAQLQHANIASIYGLEESDGVRALVMELVEGPDAVRASRARTAPARRVPLDRSAFERNPGGAFGLADGPAGPASPEDPAVPEPVLTNEDRALLAPLVPELRSLEIYSYSDLRRILTRADFPSNERIDLWRKRVEAAIEAENGVVFEGLLNL